jgi:hypothetical protein
MRIATFQRRPIFDDIGRLCDVLNRDLGWARWRRWSRARHLVEECSVAFPMP